MQVLLAGTEGGGAGDRGSQVAPPHVDQQLLEGLLEARDHPLRDLDRVGRLAAVAAQLLHPVHEGGDLPVERAVPLFARPPGSGWTARVEVEESALDEREQRRHRVDVAARVGDGGAVLGKPRARHSRCACSSVTPVSAATS